MVNDKVCCEVCDLLENSPSHAAGMCNCTRHGQCYCRFTKAVESENESGDKALDAPERLWVRNAERDGHLSWMQSSGHDEGDVEYVRADVATADKLQQIRELADLGSAQEFGDAMDRLEAIVKIAG